MMKVLVRADASQEIGSGHVMRCLALASVLRRAGAEVHFICTENPGSLFKVIEKNGFIPHPLPGRQFQGGLEPVENSVQTGLDWRHDARETLRAAGGTKFDWLIVDHYGLGQEWEEAMGDLASRVLVIDDLANRSHSCDILLDQNLIAGLNERYNGLVSRNAKLLLGPKYALLQPLYAKLREEATVRRGDVRRLLVSFGGADNFGLTELAVEALLSIANRDVFIDIVLPSESQLFPSISDKVQGFSNFSLRDRQPSLGPLILQADIAIGAGGSTNWERLCLGLPALVVSVADNQRPIVDELDRLGVVKSLGSADSVDSRTIKSEFSELMHDGLDPTWSQSCFGIVDGLGAQRVCAAMGL